MTVEEKYQIVGNMHQYGGSFVKALSLALMCADSTNTAIIERAFPELMKQYLDFPGNDRR